VYWYPLYAYVRRKGYPVPEAQDLTQEFFARLLARNYFRALDRRNGKFRSFLLACLEHFLAKQWVRAHAQKRGGGLAVLSLDEEGAEERYSAERADLLTPERLYERRWALALLERALARLGEESNGAGKQALFEHLRPYLSGADSAISYGELASQLGTSEGALKVASHRLRRRYGELVREEVAHTVASPGEIDEELQNLFAALSGS